MPFQCPCGSGFTYGGCCRKYHEGEPAPNALVLMRSRYSAYALGLASYIMATTDKEHPEQKKKRSVWEKEINAFSTNTLFKRLEIRGFSEGSQEAKVTFIAYLEQAGRDVSFEETSVFAKREGLWLYAGYTACDSKIGSSTRKPSP